MLALVFVLAQVAIPPARGYVNDFAAVLDSASIRHLEQVITEVRNATRGEIAVVTLPDIGDRPAGLPGPPWNAWRTGWPRPWPPGTAGAGTTSG